MIPTTEFFKNILQKDQFLRILKTLHAEKLEEIDSS